MSVETDTSSIDAPDGMPSVGLRVMVEEPGTPARVLGVVPGVPLRIGRDEGLELRLDDTRVSRCHAVIDFDGTTATFTDLGSSNGTFVGGRRVSGRHVVRTGDVIQVGRASLGFVLSAGDARPDSRATKTPRAIDSSASGPEPIALDPSSATVFTRARRLAASSIPILVTGETGAGKEVVARTIHRYSARAGGPFVALNCAALPDTIAESELFGHERGAFTGAVTRKSGLFEAAHGGTLMLDEVSELSLANQARLLRVVQEGTITPLGGTETRSVDVRIIAATNRDLARDVAESRFREDLYYRLSGAELHMPPLRDRPRDIPALARRLLDQFSANQCQIRDDAAALMRAYRWPGNVRELRNVIECAVALGVSTELRPEHLPAAMRCDVAVVRGDDDAPSLRNRMEDIERKAIVDALELHGGNQSRAAKDLGMSRRALIYKMERFGLKPPPAGQKP